MLESLCAALGINKSAFLSGMIGGIFSMRWVPQVGWVGILSTIMFAGIAANYATAPVHAYFNIQGLHEGGVGMLIGLFSMSISAAVFKTLQEVSLVDGLRTAVDRLFRGQL